MLVWALAAACAVFWASRVLVQAQPLPAGTRTVPTTQALRGDVSRLLGAAPVNAPAAAAVAPPSSRFQLLGVAVPHPAPSRQAGAAAQAAGEGLALISVDGRPAKAYRVGASVDAALVLQRVHARGAELGTRAAGAASVSLQVAPLPPAATGVPTPATAPAAATPVFQPPRAAGLLSRTLPVLPRAAAAADDGADPDPAGAQGDGEPPLPPARPTLSAH